MSRLVVDASVAVKWFLTEPHSEHARGVLGRDHELLAPDLILPEFGNVMWKRMRGGEMTAEEAVAAVAALLQVPFQVRSSSELVVAALEIANRTQRTVYDALYLALAVSENAPLVTADERLFNALKDTPLRGHVVWVADVSAPA
jgi:predicted nucleic acid-binding protein